MNDNNINSKESLNSLLRTHLNNTMDNSLTTRLVKNVDNEISPDKSTDYSSLDPFNSDNI